MTAMRQQRAAWPWRERTGAFSWLKAATLLALLIPAASMLYDWRAGDFGPLPTIGFVYWSGVWATELLLLALAVAPVRGIFGWNRVVVVRRMIGVAALVYTLVHLVAYFALHDWNFRFMSNEVVTRLTLVVASVSLLGLLCLGATSFDAAVRRLGSGGWKRLHRANYALTLLAVSHYLLSPGIFTMQYVAAGVLFWLLAWRVLDRRGLGADLRALAALAVGATVFTVALEVVWMWAYQHVDPSDTLSDEFSLDLGVPAMWQVLGLGAAVVVAALFFPSPRALRAGRGLG